MTFKYPQSNPNALVGRVNALFEVKEAAPGGGGSYRAAERQEWKRELLKGDGIVLFLNLAMKTTFRCKHVSDLYGSDVGEKFVICFKTQCLGRLLREIHMGINLVFSAKHLLDSCACAAAAGCCVLP